MGETWSLICGGNQNENKCNQWSNGSLEENLWRLQIQKNKNQAAKRSYQNRNSLYSQLKLGWISGEEIFQFKHWTKY